MNHTHTDPAPTTQSVSDKGQRSLGGTDAARYARQGLRGLVNQRDPGVLEAHRPADARLDAAIQEQIATETTLRPIPGCV